MKFASYSATITDPSTNSSVAPTQVLNALGLQKIVLPNAEVVLEGDYQRLGDDLLLIGPDGDVTLIKNYFSGDLIPLVTPGGAVLPGDLVAALAGPIAPGQFAQLDSELDSSPIGMVETVLGEAAATRVDGTAFSLDVGSPIYQGDVIETHEDSAVGIVFIDESTFSFGEDARMVIDELIFDPSSGVGSSAFSIVQGVFVFVSGEIAENNSGDMLVRTPVATIGIRGTKVGGRAAQEGEYNTITLMPEESGVVGQISVTNDSGSTVLNTAFQTTTVSSVFEAPAAPITISPAQAGLLFSGVNRVLQQASKSSENRKQDSEDGPKTSDDSESAPDEASQNAPVAENSEGQSSEGEGLEGDGLEGEGLEGEGLEGEGLEGEGPEGEGPEGEGLEGEGPEGEGLEAESSESVEEIEIATAEADFKAEGSSDLEETGPVDGEFGSEGDEFGPEGPREFGLEGPGDLEFEGGEFGPEGPGEFGPEGFGEFEFAGGEFGPEGPSEFGPEGFGEFEFEGGEFDPEGPGEFGPEGFGEVEFDGSEFGPGGPGEFAPDDFGEIRIEGPDGLGPDAEFFDTAGHTVSDAAWDAFDTAYEVGGTMKDAMYAAETAAIETAVEAFGEDFSESKFASEMFKAFEGVFRGIEGDFGGVSTPGAEGAEDYAEKAETWRDSVEPRELDPRGSPEFDPKVSGEFDPKATGEFDPRGSGEFDPKGYEDKELDPEDFDGRVIGGEDLDYAKDIEVFGDKAIFKPEGIRDLGKIDDFSTKDLSDLSPKSFGDFSSKGIIEFKFTGGKFSDLGIDNIPLNTIGSNNIDNFNRPSNENDSFFQDRAEFLATETQPLVVGTEGNDTIRAGAGNATLVGGAGDDTFIISTSFASGVAKTPISDLTAGTLISGSSATVADDIFLQGDFLSLGISGAGSFGTAENAPSGFVTSTGRNNLGMQVDQDGFNSGSPSTTGDFFLPGSPEERWSIGFTENGSTQVTFSNSERISSPEIAKSEHIDVSDGKKLQARWTGETTTTSSGNQIEIQQLVSFDTDQKFFRTDVILTNTGSSAITDLRYMRSFDPDQDRDTQSTFFTKNEVLAQVPTEGRALVVAEGDLTGVEFFFLATSGDAVVYSDGFRNPNPYSVGGTDFHSNPQPAGTNIGRVDEAIGIIFERSSSLSPGSSQSWKFFSSLDDDFDSVLAKASADDNPTLIVEQTGEGTDTVLSDVNFSLPDNVENLTLTGAGAVNGTGNAGDNTLVGNEAANVLIGESGADILTGSGGTDRLFGGDGNDKLNGGTGADTLVGNDGQDVITGGDGADSFKFLNPTDGVAVSSDSVVSDSNASLANDFSDFSTSEGDKIQIVSGTFGISSLTSGTNFFAINNYNGTNANGSTAVTSPHLIFDASAGDGNGVLIFDDTSASAGYTVLAEVNSGQGIAITDIEILT